MTLLLAQIAIILLVTLSCGAIAQRLGQAKVIGEMVGGIVLGPSLFGRLAPHASGTLFPQGSLQSLETLSNVGLILFLFLLGAELDLTQLRRQRTTAVLASLMSIALPFAMAVGVAPLLRSRFPSPASGTLVFTLFLGIAMSITALPVLARILEERGIQATALGTTALVCAAVDDLFAWSLLAVAMTLLPSPVFKVSPLGRLALLVIYLAVMLGLVQPLCRWIARRWNHTQLSYEGFGITLALVLGSSAATEAIGVHPLCGALLAGICFPRVSNWQQTLRTRLDTIVSVLLLPLFFALTGLRTRLDLLNTGELWVWAGVVLLIAIAGKMGGSVCAARWAGQSWHDAFALGVLLNTRGMVELIVLNIAFNAHVFSPSLFAIMVLMALLTTMMTSPLLNELGVEQRRIPA